MILSDHSQDDSNVAVGGIGSTLMPIGRKGDTKQKHPRKKHRYVCMVINLKHGTFNMPTSYQ